MRQGGKSYTTDTIAVREAETRRFPKMGKSHLFADIPRSDLFLLFSTPTRNNKSNLTPVLSLITGVYLHVVDERDDREARME